MIKILRCLPAAALVLSLGMASSFAEELFDTEAAKNFFDAGLELYDKGNYEEAIKQFEEASRIDPENTNAVYFVGYSYYKLRNMEKAMEVFQEAYSIDSKYSPIREVRLGTP